MKGNRSSWKVYVVTLLAVLTAATMVLSSATMAKYIASAGLTASSRVASWSIAFTQKIPAYNATMPSGTTANNSGIIKLHGSYLTHTVSGVLTIKNNSEVAAVDPTVSLTFTAGSGGPTGYSYTLTRNPASTALLPPKSTNAASYDLKVTATGGADGYITAIINCRTNQQN